MPTLKSAGSSQLFVSLALCAVFCQLKKGDSYAHCTVCKADFSIAHGGSFDIKCHRDGKVHSDLERKSKSENIASYFKAESQQ